MIPEEFAFGDFETIGRRIGTIGALNYFMDPDANVLTLHYAIGDGDVEHWVRGQPFPLPLKQHIKNGGYFVAWNAAFDRMAWQMIAEELPGWPRLESDQVLDAMAQAQASNLPASLDQAASACGFGGKQSDGKKLINLFCDVDNPVDIAHYPVEWERFLSYGDTDVERMRQVWNVTRPLSAEEWRDYHVSERINSRGFEIDKAFCEKCAQFYETDKEHTASEVRRITEGDIARQSLTQQINKWVFARLPDDLSRIMVTEWDEQTHEAKRLSLGKDRLHMLLEDIMASDHPPADNVVELLEVLEFGRSSSALKFTKMADQAVLEDDGSWRLCNTYTFNGAGQTGRFSSRGVQMHNLPNKRVERDGVCVEGEVYDLIADNPVN